MNVSLLPFTVLDIVAIENIESYLFCKRDIDLEQPVNLGQKPKIYGVQSMKDTKKNNILSLLRRLK